MVEIFEMPCQLFALACRSCGFFPCSLKIKFMVGLFSDFI